MERCGSRRASASKAVPGGRTSQGIAVGSDGAVWFTEADDQRVSPPPGEQAVRHHPRSRRGDVVHPGQRKHRQDHRASCAAAVAQGGWAQRLRVVLDQSEGEGHRWRAARSGRRPARRQANGQDEAPLASGTCPSSSSPSRTREPAGRRRRRGGRAGHGIRDARTLRPAALSFGWRAYGLTRARRQRQSYARQLRQTVNTAITLAPMSANQATVPMPVLKRRSEAVSVSATTAIAP